MTSSKFTELYVVPFPTLLGDDADGSLARPYSSLKRALDHVEHKYYRSMTSLPRRTAIYLYPTYHFVNTLHLNRAHSRIRITTMNTDMTAFYEELIVRDHTYRRLSRASISGGMPITHWIEIDDDVYKAVVPSTVYVNQLFADDRRIIRTRIPMNQSAYLQYEAPLNDPNQARYGFQYVQGQFDSIPLNDVMVVVYHSWTTSHHYIDQIITSNRTILFTNPSDLPIGTFTMQGKRRFHIENSCLALVSNSFCFVNETKTIYLKTNGSYNPNNIQIITPIHEFIMLIASTDARYPINNIIIDNIAIQHSAWNIGRRQQADSQAAAFLNSAALYIANATSIIISNVEINHIGSYGIWIKEGTTNVNVFNSLVTDTAAGGIRIGQMIASVSTPTTSIKIISNEVSYGGNVFPSGVAVIVHCANDVIIADNSIHHHRNSGISAGSVLGYKESYTSNIIIQNNYIYNIGQHILCDQGGIYTLGIQPGTIIDGNVIKNVFSYAIFMWGIYLDEGTSQVIVSNNIVYNTGWASFFQHYGANNTIVNNVFACASVNPAPHSDDTDPDGDIHIGLAENHTSIIFTRNIIYDTFQGEKHSVYLSSPNVIAPFNDNVYYNPYGTSLLFGSQQVSFIEWQKTGQDNNSVIADPLFIGDVNQCDFFTIRSDSPAAKLGFANITKLSKWTSGCDANDENDNNQFYHW
ncbi:unnamed protein product [Rotaria sp. Silwood1]|nr:unnamed protein product [Rotaria sp. Silwood1]CAF1308609.1 unnamed protein product [Rotaria sp. Silwood1]CAF1319520.1 unnamed protein product [Rotaria sp. Silwood1]